MVNILYKDKLWLYEQYWLNALCARQIAKLAGSSKATIYRWLKKHNIAIRTRSDAMKQAHKQGYWKGQSAAIKAAHNRGVYGNAYRRKQSEAMRAARARGTHDHVNWSEFVTAAHQRGVYVGVHQSPTSLEIDITQALTACGIEYETQYRFKGDTYPYDFFILGTKLLIEVDGEFWHHSDWAREQGNMARDLKKNNLAAENGFNLIRIREKELKKHGALEIVIERVLPLCNDNH